MSNYEPQASDGQELTKPPEQVLIKRPVYSLASFEREFLVDEQTNGAKQKSIGKTIKSFVRKYFNVLGIFTIVNLFAEYKCKEYLLPDILSGLTGTLTLKPLFYNNLTMYLR